jgi:hypothetical protein
MKSTKLRVKLDRALDETRRERLNEVGRLQFELEALVDRMETGAYEAGAPELRALIEAAEKDQVQELPR